MADLFRGWRPKLGLVALLFALLTTAAWVRSLDQYDLFSLVTSSASIQVLESHEGRFYWTRIEKTAPAHAWNWHSICGMDFQLAKPVYSETIGDAKSSFFVTKSGDGFLIACSTVATAIFRLDPYRTSAFSVWSFSYSMICLPLTAMAGLLVLWPRSRLQRTSPPNLPSA